MSLDERTYSNNTWNKHIMKSGTQRRADILNTIKKYQYESVTMPGLPVNNKWQWSTKDTDIKRLLKKGLAKQIRHATPCGRNQNTGLKRGGKGQSYLILVEKK